jgi:hypothetical protein
VAGRRRHRRGPLTAALAALTLVAASGTAAAPHQAAATPADPAVNPPLAVDLPADGRTSLPGPQVLFDRHPRPWAAGKPRPAAPPAAAFAPELAADGIPAVALTAYRKAEARLAKDQRGCHLRWYLVAAIGRVESDHGRYGGAQLRTDGTSTPKILGVPLDGRPGFALVRDTDHGRYDGDTHFDRAVGPMQFIPGTWAGYAADGNGDGRTDPFNLFDAGLAAAAYLCNGHDLSTEAGQRAAVHNYNHSDEYVDLVLAVAAQYAHGVRVDRRTAPAPGNGRLPTPPKGAQPPVSVGPPPAGRPTPAPTTTAPTTAPAPTASPTGSATPTGPAPSPTDTSTPTPSPTQPAPTETATPTPTCSPTDSPTPTPTDSPTPTPTPTCPASDSPTPSPTASPADSPTVSSTPTPASTPDPTTAGATSTTTASGSATPTTS